METIQVTAAWHTTFAGGHVGLLLIGPVNNARQLSPLDEHKRAIETAARQKYAGMTRTDLQQLDNLKAYKSYYRKFNKTYRVQLQLESVVHKGKALPSVNPLNT